ncbi:hypothetical protein GXB85_05365 [Cellulomonas sp. APG4]|uniref:hypothetical protein n=1 Tax=Cellulomonas sp. APG4 TaxID=1538656 RepID=UPI00137B78B7|nr:hypothetical protein [Cellulomonas sp. APG4]NCT90380.1 hypothetical protein [Cellulomonas sp. APG4]
MLTVAHVTADSIVTGSGALTVYCEGFAGGARSPPRYKRKKKLKRATRKKIESAWNRSADIGNRAVKFVTAVVIIATSVGVSRAGVLSLIDEYGHHLAPYSASDAALHTVGVVGVVVAFVWSVWLCAKAGVFEMAVSVFKKPERTPRGQAYKERRAKRPRIR